ncbi:MAG: hypothetical protein ABR587_12960 [Candidatus Binatia bacterium]
MDTEPESALRAAAARIAVLPFDSLSEDASDAYFARGFVEDLITELSRFPTLEVLHPDSALAEDRSFDAAALGVTLCLRGSVRRFGEAVRITAQLADAGSGRRLWAERFDASASELLAAQDDIVAHVASTLALEIDNGRLSQARRRPLASLDVYDCCLRGLDALRAGSLEDDARARTFFERALELDPSCARAHAGLSLSHFNEWSCQAWELFDDKERLAYEHASRAAALDDSDAHVQMVLARVLLFRRDFEGGAHRVERAIALNPNDADVLAHAALACTYLGRAPTAVGMAQKAIRLHPRHPEWYLPSLTMSLFGAGRYAEAVEVGAKAPRAFVDIPAYLAASAALAGDLARAAGYVEMLLAGFRDKITFGRAPEPGEPLRWVEHVNPFRRPEDLEPLARGLALAGLAVDPDVGARREPTPRPRHAPERPEFRREADVWTVVFGGEMVRLGDVKGFADLAVLLGRPDQEVHCLELAGRPLDGAGADAQLDERARREVRTRIRNLEEEIEDAERLGDLGRGDRAREELDQLVETLTGALGLGGRPRRIGSQVERARCTVTWRIKSAVRKVAAVHPTLGRHLTNAVRTGTTCVYQPETSVDWQL